MEGTIDNRQGTIDNGQWCILPIAYCLLPIGNAEKKVIMIKLSTFFRT